MAVDKRLRYFDGQFLQAVDFIDEQTYHIDRLQSHTAQLHTPGIAADLGFGDHRELGLPLQNRPQAS